MSLIVKHPFVSGVADDPAAIAAGEVIPSAWDAAHNVTGTVDPSIGARTLLTADATYYIATTGSDSNPGTSALPFATLQFAMDFITGNIDGAGSSIVLQLADGTYSGFTEDVAPVAVGEVRIQGHSGDATKVTIKGNGLASSCVDFEGDYLSIVYLKDLTLDGNGFESIELDASYIYMFLDDVTITNSSATTPFAGIGNYSWYSTIQINTGNIKFDKGTGGGWQTGIWLDPTALCLVGNNFSCTMVNTPNFTASFFGTTGGMWCTQQTFTFSGAATGLRFFVQFGNVFTNGGGLSYFPGNTAGILDQASTYDGLVGTGVDYPQNATSYRTVLTSDVSFYVASTGSDSNDGSSGSKWATIQHAMNFIASTLDFAGFTVTVNIGAGSFVGPNYVSCEGGGNLYFNGAGVASTTLTVSSGGQSVSVGQASATTIFINNITFDGTGCTGAAIQISSFTIVIINTDPAFIAAGSTAFKNLGIVGIYAVKVTGSEFADSFGTGGATTITGNAAGFMSALEGVVCTLADTYTIAGAPTFSDAFIVADLGTQLDISGGSFSGACTGIRFKVRGNSNINSNADSAGTQLPGNAVGQITENSSYTGITDFVGIVASLPSANIKGTRCFVTDALAATFGSPPAGGHATFVPVYNTGAAWIMG